MREQNTSLPAKTTPERRWDGLGVLHVGEHPAALASWQADRIAIG